MSWQDEYLQRYYSYPGYLGGTEEFHSLIASQVAPTATVLELGAGPTNPSSQFLAETFMAVDGLDVDEACRGNKHLRKAYVYDGGRWPMADESYDAVVCNYVLEHIATPAETVREICRVLRPGGVFLFRTPNRWHYVSLVSRFTPHWFHERVANRLRNLSDEAEDPYPTYYRMNSAPALRRLFAAGGFGERVLRTIEKEPSYGMAAKPLFLLFMLYERLVNSAEEFSFARVNILGVFEKPR
jgi:SAM-dependent methyltransferase